MSSLNCTPNRSPNLSPIPSPSPIVSPLLSPTVRRTGSGRKLPRIHPDRPYDERAPAAAGGPVRRPAALLT
ncbi:hypothetical protein PRIPAC_86473, partial [Pristionchus pacificus]|uniref:Uncharacterized protein n=1 Tax=Pristionchus pacificus TaxID=54126 RepID=A0A2A6BL21_PRIPA